LILIERIFLHHQFHLLRFIDGGQPFPLEVIDKSLEAYIAFGEGAVNLRQSSFGRRLYAAVAGDDHQPPLLIQTKLNGNQDAVFLD